jgi:electron transfer flavoprotein beta subunit
METLTMDELKVDAERCGMTGSPTKVYKVDSVVLAGGEHIKIESTKEGMNKLVDKLMDDHIFG